MKYRNETNVFILVAAALLLPLSAGCGGKKQEQPPPAAVSVNFAQQTHRVEAGKSVTLNVTAQNTGVNWPVPSPTEGSLTPNGNSAVYTPVLPRSEIEKTYEIRVTASADPTKNATARVTVYFPVEHTFYYGINNGGQVIGEFHNSSDTIDNVRAFVKDGDDYTVVDNPGSVGNTYVYGINDSGHVLGYYENENRYFLKAGGVYQELEDYPGARFTEYTGINDSGRLSGYFTNSGGYARGFIKTGGGFEIIDHPDAGSAVCDHYWQCGTFITGINNSGAAAGYFIDSDGVYRGFVKDGGAYTPVNVDAAAGDDATNVVVEGINDSGRAAGYFYDADSPARGFVFFMSGEGFEIIDHPDASGDGYGVRVFGINDSGRVAGWFDDGGKARGFLRQID